MVCARTNSYGCLVVEEDDVVPPPQVVTFECRGRGTLYGELVEGKNPPLVIVKEPREHRGIYLLKE